MDAETFGIRIYHPENNSIEIEYEYDKGQRQGPFTMSMDDDDNLSVWCIKNKKDIFLNDNSKEYIKYVNKIVVIDGEMTHSLMFCPMILKDKVIGVITVQSYQKNRYTKKHLDILRTLANYTAIAFDNALLYDNMEGEVNLRTAEIEKQKIVLEDKNLKITDSINYAQRIQQAILPSQEMISAILPNSFIFFKPKDIVSGDFYWAHAINKHEILFAAVDCTGHGVPGAFMSIMGYNLLEQIVKENKIYQPALILSELSKLVVNSLKQTDAIGSVKEGMDIALCKINYKNLELEYAGAHNSLNLIRNGILTETKANQRSIGISTTSSVQFHNHKIKLEKGDCVYIFSDGYADQFGGQLNQKFFYQPFRELLVDIHKLSMEKQEKKLEKVISQWKGEREQTDDMLVIGVKI
jgi:serine phosphatase RsbU (regulator of sigma subunit)